MPDYQPRPPEKTLEILTAAAQTILWESNAEVVYLYGSGGRYFNKVDDPELTIKPYFLPNSL